MAQVEGSTPEERYIRTYLAFFASRGPATYYFAVNDAGHATLAFDQGRGQEWFDWDLLAGKAM